jgi:hypothetical protein
MFLFPNIKHYVYSAFINFQFHSHSSQVCTHSVFSVYQPVHFQACYKQYSVILYTALMSSKQVFKYACARFRTFKLFSLKDGAFMTCVI